MNKEQVRSIIELVFKKRNENRAKQEATETYWKIAYPGNYAPIIETDWGDFMPLVLGEALWDWLQYFLYEAEDFYPNCEITENEKTVVIENDEQAINWLVEYFINNNK